MKAYTGIGSRRTPVTILAKIEQIAMILAGAGWTCRTGGAEGADTAFEIGAGQTAEVYLPWPKFGHGQGYGIVKRVRPQPEAYPIAARFHPVWNTLGNGAQALHARNVHQVLGPEVHTPHLSRFVLCWTPNAAGGGGTGQAIRIARHYNVPVFDLADSATLARVEAGLLTR